MTTKKRTIIFGRNASTGRLEILKPSGGLTPPEVRHLTAELRRRHGDLLRRTGHVVSVETPLAAYPAGWFRIDASRANGSSLLLLNYVEHPGQLQQKRPSPLEICDIEQFACDYMISVPEGPLPQIDRSWMGTPVLRRLAVFTTDRANFHEAANHAADLGVAAEMHFPKDRPSHGDDWAELWDPDHFTTSAAERDALLKRLSGQPVTRPTGLYSYNVDQDAQAALEAVGIIVARRLQRALVAAVLLGKPPTSLAVTAAA
jgi:hypothetical protein